MDSINTDWQPSCLQNNIVRLEPLKISDFERLYEVASDPLIWEQHPEKERYQRPVFQKFFDGAIASGTAFLITDAGTGEVIGSTRFYGYDRENSSINIGFTFLTRRCWGGVFNLAAKTLLLDYAFQFVEKVYFHVGPHNTRSLIAVGRLGATEDSIVDFDHYGNKLPHRQLVLERAHWENRADKKLF